MRSLIVLAVLAMVSVALGSGAASAADRAATSALPAALAAANVHQDQVLTSSAADGLRGQAFWVMLNGNVNTYVYQGSMWIQGYVNLINLQISPYSLVIYGY